MPKTDGKQVAETKVSKNRTTTVPEAIRTAEGIGPGDRVEWRLIDSEWVLRPADDGDGCDCEGRDGE